MMPPATPSAIPAMILLGTVPGLSPSKSGESSTPWVEEAAGPGDVADASARFSLPVSYLRMSDSACVTTMLGRTLTSGGADKLWAKAIEAPCREA